MKVNKICNLDHPVYKIDLCWFSAPCISEHFVFCIITHIHLEKNCLNFHKMAA